MQALDVEDSARSGKFDDPSGRSRRSSNMLHLEVEDSAHSDRRESARRSSGGGVRRSLNNAPKEALNSSDDAKAEKGATVLSSVLNLSNVIMGVGLLALPLGFKQAGWFGGTMFVIFSAGLAILSLHLLSESAKLVQKEELAKTGESRPSSFKAVGEAAIPGFGIFVDCVVVLNGFIAATSFLIVATDSFEKTADTTSWLMRHAWLCLAVAGVLPLALLRKLDALKFTSLLAVVMLIFITILALLMAVRIPNAPALVPCKNQTTATTPGPCDDAFVSAFGSPIQTLKAFSTFVTAFKCQQNLFSVTNELERPTTRRVLIVSTSAISLSLLLYVVVAWAGYLTFGSLVNGDLLESYPSTPIVDVARLGIALVVITSYPLTSFAVRSSMRSLLSLCSCAVERWAPANEVYRCHKGAACELFALEQVPLTISLVFVLITFIISAILKDLGFVVEIGGAIVGNILMLVTPGFCYYRLHRTTHPRAPLTIVALVLFIMGVLLVPIGVAVSFVK